MQSGTEAAMAIEALVAGAVCTDEVVDYYIENTNKRFTPQRYLDENEREWFALDEICRSRPWATNKDQAFEYPFRKTTAEMMKAEGNWKGWAGERVDTRGEISGVSVKQVIVPQEFPAECRVIVFTPEFGNDRSYDTENWTYLEPEQKVDVWVVSWQGWDKFDEMLDQVQHSVLSFADGVSTVWFGQGMGGLVAYELLKMFDKRHDQSPNLPVSLIVSDCPAPHLFSETYKPYDDEAKFTAAKKSDKIDALQNKIVEGDLKIMKEYIFKHGDDKGLPIPICALTHEENACAPEDAVKAWEEYAKEDGFEFVDPLDAEEVEMEEYLRGKGYGLNIDPAIVTTCNQHHEELNRKKIEDETYPDIGPTDGEIPDEVDDVVCGAGIQGLFLAWWLAQDGKNTLIFDKHHAIGGVWDFYANDYSRVNTSEIGYRCRQPDGRWARCNEDHTPRYYMVRDMYANTAEYNYGKVRLEIEVTKVDDPEEEGGKYTVHYKHVKTGKEGTVKATGCHFATNRRIGDRRLVNYPGVENFKGKELYGYARENAGLTFWGTHCIIVGAGAFAYENVRTVIEHGSKMCTMVCRREGTASPKWIDQLAFFRPRDNFYGLKKAGDMISFEVWSSCYTRAGIKTPECWKEGLLKPNNHTISTSDLVFIAAYHGMYVQTVGEIKEYKSDGKGVELKDGRTLDVDFVIKCTGFHFAREVEKITGCPKMYPWQQVKSNMMYAGEPLLDAGQFAATKVGEGEDEEKGKKGLEVAVAHGVKDYHLYPRALPFGSGLCGPAMQSAKYCVWLRNHPKEQSALLKLAGAPRQNTTEYWASQIGPCTFETALKVLEQVAA